MTDRDRIRARAEEVASGRALRTARELAREAILRGARAKAEEAGLPGHVGGYRPFFGRSEAGLRRTEQAPVATEPMSREAKHERHMQRVRDFSGAISWHGQAGHHNNRCGIANCAKTPRGSRRFCWDHRLPSDRAGKEQRVDCSPIKPDPWEPCECHPETLKWRTGV